MALDGLLLHQIDQELQAKLPCRINKIQNISDVELLWTLRSAQQTLRLLISLHSTYNRISFYQGKLYDAGIADQFRNAAAKTAGGWLHPQVRAGRSRPCAAHGSGGPG